MHGHIIAQDKKKTILKEKEKGKKLKWKERGRKRGKKKIRIGTRDINFY